jgi:hypothetical protein
MKYQISESQYRKIILNYLNNIASDFIFEERHRENDSYVDVTTSNGDNFGAIWYGGAITMGCAEELSLNSDLMSEIEDVIPIMIPKLFSEVVLEYFNSKTGSECDCLEFTYVTEEYDQWDDPLTSTFHFNIKKQ